ncbi:MAG: bifunctional folylpolyglutamate synthase/dihydrofolate synthase [Coprobacillaceae bacterium]
MFTTYEEVVQFINTQKNRVYSLDNLKKYMNDCGNPQYQLPCIHIGGTNGKGSTTNYVKEVLQVAGYKVATFTSPTLQSRLEAIRINEINITDETMVRFANQYVDTWLKYELSMFEIEVCIAILYFLESNVDIAIFEVGLGGTLDATNIVKPLVAANTNIGLDHVDYLGNTYQEIAYNKGGIIKDNIDFITGETKVECLEVFEKLCEEHHSQLYQVQKISHIEDGENVKYQYRDLHITLQTPALYQVKNSALAIEILLYLKENNNFNFTIEQLLHGLYQAKWAGRFETISKHPHIIIDGAHNKEGMEAFLEGAKKYSNCKIIFSALRDKDTHSMIEYLLRLSSDIIVCEFEHVRAADVETLANGFPVKIEKDYRKAIDEAMQHQGTIFITGSLYFIALARSYILKKGESTF